jgi:arylsulfatase A-like enzyme
VSEPSRRAFLASALQTAGRTRPNLLFIVTDSWRGQALPCAGDPDLIAPNLARLAKEGLYCGRAYTSYAVCCPSRAAMLTGKFPHAAGVRRNHTLLPLNQTTMSEVLKSRGYRTGYIGKWHLDGQESPGFVPPERRRGFDYWAAYNLSHQHFDSVYFRDTPTPIKIHGFEAEHQTDLAIDFLRQPGRRPFFLYLSMIPPHAPFTPPERYANYRPDQLRLRPNVPERAEAAARKDLAGYYGLCTAADANLGRLFQALDERGLARDTIVVFTSDHGHMMGSQGLDGFDVPFEESVRIPLLIRYPRRIKAGTEDVAPVSNVDFAPTLLSLCGTKLPRGMQGFNHAESWTGGRKSPPGAIFAEGALDDEDEWRMIVRGPHKLVANAQWKPTHLYDLSVDPYESNNLAAHPDARGIVATLMPLLREWASRI